MSKYIKASVGKGQKWGQQILKYIDKVTVFDGIVTSIIIIGAVVRILPNNFLKVLILYFSYIIKMDKNFQMWITRKKVLQEGLIEEVHKGYLYCRYRTRVSRMGKEGSIYIPPNLKW